MRLLAWAVALSAMTGCVLLHDDAATNGGGGAGLQGTGAGSVTATSSTGGSGGQAGGGGQGGASAPICPTSDFDVSLSANAYADAFHGAVSPLNGRTTVAGKFNDLIDVGLEHFESADFPDHQGYFVANIDASGILVNAKAVGLGVDANSSVTHVEPTSDGGSVVVFSGRAPVADGHTIPEVSPTTTVVDVLVAKFSSLGELEWTRLIEGGEAPVFVTLVHTRPGRIAIGGNLNAPTTLTTQWNSDVASRTSDVVPVPSLFLLEYDLSGTPLDTKYFAGTGKWSGMHVVNGRRFFYGQYVGLFPDFNYGMTPPSLADSAALFAVELATDGHALNERKLGYANRINEPAGMVDGGDGLVVFASTAEPSPPLHLPGTFAGLANRMIGADNQVASFVRLDTNLDVQWLETNTITEKVQLHSPGTTSDGSPVLGFHLLDVGSTVFDAVSYSQPQTDTLWLRRLSTGRAPSFYSAGPASADPTLRSDLVRSAGPCGDLLLGRVNTDYNVEGHLFQGGPNSFAVIAFREAGLSFQ